MNNEDAVFIAWTLAGRFRLAVDSIVRSVRKLQSDVQDRYVWQRLDFTLRFLAGIRLSEPDAWTDWLSEEERAFLDALVMQMPASYEWLKAPTDLNPFATLVLPSESYSFVIRDETMTALDEIQDAIDEEFLEGTEVMAEC